MATLTKLQNTMETEFLKPETGCLHGVYSVILRLSYKFPPAKNWPERKIEASPAACIVRGRSQQKSFLFLLEEKIRRAQNQKSRENFFAGWRALASGGGAASNVGVGFPLKKGSCKASRSPRGRRAEQSIPTKLVLVPGRGLEPPWGYPR